MALIVGSKKNSSVKSTKKEDKIIASVQAAISLKSIPEEVRDIILKQC